MTQNPNVQNGKMTEAEAFAEYISSFEPEFLNREQNERDSRVRPSVLIVNLKMVFSYKYSEFWIY